MENYNISFCATITDVGKFIIIVFLIILGLFGVFVINNNSAKVEPATENSTLNIPSISPSPSPAIIDSMSNQATASAIIKTSKGNIELTLYALDAPNTVKNFIEKAKSGFYDNLIFHRVEDWVIQGGDPDGNGTGGGNMKVEFNNKPFVIGALGVASRGDNVNQNDAQFFITKTDAQFLNGKYTNFGQVTKGMDVVNKIEIGDKILEIQTP